jgi:hypothetical protein
MHPDNIDDSSLEEYHALELMLHRDLMECCRKHINDLGIISIIGIVDIVKNEVIELEKATKTNIEKEKTEAIS